MEYSVLSQPKSSPAIDSMITFNPNMIFHESIPFFSDKNTAIKSVPPDHRAVVEAAACIAAVICLKKALKADTMGG